MKKKIDISTRTTSEPVRTWRRPAVAVVLGVLFSAFICLANPHNTYIMDNPALADGYLPTAAAFFILLLAMGYNPLIRWLSARFGNGQGTLALDFRQLALLFGIMLVASATMSGLMRTLPYMIAKVPVVVSQDANLAKLHKEMNLPPSLFPDKLGYHQKVSASEYFLKELPKKKGSQTEFEPIPWKAWYGPLMSWGSFGIFCALMMIGLGAIVIKQWRKNERLPFPLVTVQEAMIADPKSGHFLGELFRSKGFWIVAGIVLLLNVLKTAKGFAPDAIPAIPLNWDFSSMFTEEPLNYVPSHIYKNSINFAVLGLVFFIPNRISFSIWFFTLAYAFYQMVAKAYMPPYAGEASVADDRLGAALAMTVAIVWLGRAHWWHILRNLFKLHLNPEENRDRNGFVMFATGCVGMYFWMLWIGVQWPWALLYVGFAFIVAILIARILAETGFVGMQISLNYQMTLVTMAPVAWLNDTTLYFATAFYFLILFASKSSISVMTTHALALNERMKPASQTAFAWGMVLITAMAIVLGGIGTLAGNYHHSMSLDGRFQPVNSFSTERLDPANTNLQTLADLKSNPKTADGPFDRPQYSQAKHIMFGATLAGALQWASLVWPRWPLHPLGLLMVDTYDAAVLWATIFLGWLIKSMLVWYGGASLYRKAQSAFIGLVVGEVLFKVGWLIVRSLLLASGNPDIMSGAV